MRSMFHGLITARSKSARGLVSGILMLAVASGTLLAQAGKSPITNSEVRDEHSAIGVAGSKAPASFHRNASPDAQWYPTAGLGLFIHWGISTVEAKSGISWQMVAGRELSKARLTPEEIQKIIATNGWKSVTTPRHYWSLAPQFKPDKYDPDKWLRAAKAAGFKYAVLTTRHHDGFALWPSAYGNFNTKNFMGGKDLVKEYVEAARRNGLKVGFYYSPPDWYFTQKYNSFLYHGAKKMNPELPDLDIDLKAANLPKPTPEETKAYRDYLRGQIKELLTNYGKIDMLWFDGKPDVISIDEIRAMQPGIVVNDRMWGHGDIFTRSERNLASVRPAKEWWENCQVWANSSWAYVDEDYKPNSSIIEQFVRVRAWNGNFLLNVGPMSNGELPPIAYDRMTEFGNWVHQNEEAIFGTTDAPDAEHANVPVTARAGVRYLHAVPSFQDTTLELTGTKRPKSVRLLRDGKPLKFEWSEQGGLKVEIPATMRTPLVDVVKVELP
jgi:alpha-L-fucosidase